LYYRLGLLRLVFAAHAALLLATIFLVGGIIGTCHHLYFSGTPTVALAWGSVFSALEVVPLTLVAYGAMDDLALARATPWVQRYRWPIYFTPGGTDGRPRPSAYYGSHRPSIQRSKPPSASSRLSLR
jgi:nitric oxide reductase subunit B